MNSNASFRNVLQQGFNALDECNWNQAVDLFTDVQSQKPNHPVPLYFLSLALFAAGRLEESKTALAKGVQKNPANAIGHNLAALHALRSGNIVEGIATLKQHGLVEHPRIQAFFLLEIEKNLLRDDP